MPLEGSTFPFEIKDVDEAENQELLRDMTGERTGWLKIGPKKYCLPSKYRNDASIFYNFPIKESDTWIVTFPRSGTTMTQEMVWLVANNFDFDSSFKTPLIERFPFLEYHLFMHEETKEMFKRENDDIEKKELIEKLATPGYKVVNQLQGPRFIKTHLPLSLLPQDLLKSKVIYLARNAKDVCLSYYHLLRLMRTSGYIGDVDTFWDYFERSLVPWAPYFEHVNEGWQMRNHPNLLFLFYEDVIQDMPAAINKVAKFLNKSITEKNMADLCDHLAINNFRKNPSVNFDILKKVGIQAEGEQEFVRKGKSGSSNHEFSPELTERADKWIKENSAKMEWKIPNHEKRKAR